MTNQATQDLQAMATQATQATQADKDSSRAKWFQNEIDILIKWLSVRDANGILNNAILYKKHGVEASRRIFRDTELAAIKPEVTEKMIFNKLRTMNSAYVKWRDKAESTGWGVDPVSHNDLTNGPGSQTIKSVILKGCAWYYEFEDLFGTNPNVAAPFLSESGHPDRVNSKPAGEEEVERENNDTDDEAIEWDATPVRELENDALDDILLEEDFEKELKAIQRSEDSQSILIDQSIAPTPKAVPSTSTANSLTMRTPVTSRSETPAVKTKGKRKKPSKAIVEVFSSSEEERSAKKTKTPRQRSVADAMIEVERIRDATRTREAEAQQIRFEAEQKQRDQQHAILLQQGQERLNAQQETLLRLQLQLRKAQGEGGESG